MSAITNVLNSFDPISLSELGHSNLLDRLDTKYVFSKEQLPMFLHLLCTNYRVLEVNHHRSITYNTVYFDTPELNIYQAHHCGRGNRYKVRYRKYLENNLTFFEIKLKNNKGRTIKSRLGTLDMESTIEGKPKAFLETTTPLQAQHLHPSLCIRYQRTTLVHRSSAERVTFDSNIQFENNFGLISLSHLTLAEVKQEKSAPAQFTSLMKMNNLREGFMSKYCFGMASLVPGLRQNNFKPTLNRFLTTTICQ